MHSIGGVGSVAWSFGELVPILMQMVCTKVCGGLRSCDVCHAVIVIVKVV
jgi:hypothetical protein